MQRVSGHLFLVRGDLRHLACDAVLVPSGTPAHGGAGFGEVSRSFRRGWDGRLETDEAGRIVGESPNSDQRVVLHTEAGDSPQRPSLWIGHTGEGGRERDPPWLAAAATQFVREAAVGPRVDRAKAPLDDDRPLLALPLIGVGEGGAGPIRGEVMHAVVSAIRGAQENVDADVVLVLQTDEAYSAAQQARETAGVRWPDAGEHEDVIHELADFARRDRLVLFFGAGASMGAGLPSWRRLLKELADAAGLADRLDELEHLDARDAATIIESRLTDRGVSLGVAMSKAIEGTQSSLVHALLASLPVTEAVTTNYDGLFEQAWSDVVGAEGFRLLPRDNAQDAKRWLLKLHGGPYDREHLVLSRNDYLRFEGEGAALAGVVQAMLLTRHMLFVGYSLSDDNFHRIAHQARAALGPATERANRSAFGTALMPDVGLGEELWKDDVRFVGGVGPRNVAIILDQIGALASAPSAYLLDRDWDALLNEPERSVRDKLLGVSKELEQRSDHLRPGVRDAIERFMDDLGAGGVRSLHRRR